MITSRYYYDRLNERDKRIYKEIYNGIMHFKPYVEVPGADLSDNNVGWIYHCVLWDNPFIFFVGEYAMWHAVTTDRKRIKMTTLCDKHSERVYRKQIEDEVNKILSAPRLSQMSDFQKEVFVHDFIINNVEYDHTLGDGGARIQPYTVYGALVEHKAVCEGIAKAVKLLLNMLDVKCIVVSGKFDGHGHAWNIVKLDDFAYHLDVTMDMGRVVHSGKMRYNYFNFRDNEITNYTIDNAHIIPRCTAIHNNYLVRAGGFVSNYERLKKYIENGLKKKKSCLYFKVNRNVQDQYTGITFSQFQNEINRAYIDVVNKLHINTSRYVDSTGPCEVVSVEIKYL